MTAANIYLLPAQHWGKIVKGHLMLLQIGRTVEAGYAEPWPCLLTSLCLSPPCMHHVCTHSAPTCTHGYRHSFAFVS